MPKLNKDLKRNLILGVTSAVIVTAVVFEKRRVAEIVLQSQDAVLYTMTESFQSGVEYGLKLARENAAALMTPLAEVHQLSK